MRNYLDLLEHVMTNGTVHQNRTGIPTRRVLGAMLEFDLAQGFPAVTTKKLAFGAVKGELIGFIRGYQSAADFRMLGCGVWDQNANENKAWLDNPNREGEDDLGRIYGVQWRRWNNDAYYGPDACTIDQLKNALNEVMHNPTSRRIIVNAWNPADLDKMALPPCHVMFQYHVDEGTNTLSMTMYQRSCDLFLGVPFNIASYALLLEMSARATRRQVGKLVMFLSDVHIYENHLDQVAEQLKREPRPLANLVIVDSRFGDRTGISYLESVAPSDVLLLSYSSHDALKAPMAV